jgi:hypothetical protein
MFASQGCQLLAGCSIGRQAPPRSRLLQVRQPSPLPSHIKLKSMGMLLLEEHCRDIERLEGHSLGGTQPVQRGRDAFSKVGMRKQNGDDRCADASAGLPYQVLQKHLRGRTLSGWNDVWRERYRMPSRLNSATSLSSSEGSSRSGCFIPESLSSTLLGPYTAQAHST